MLNSLVLSVTSQCPIQCKYCGVHASPLRKERMTREYMFRMIDEVRTFEFVPLIVFTGGEPFMLGEDLYSTIEYAAKKGFLTRIVSNAYWAISKTQALNILSRLKDLGLSEINFSCDDFHQEYVPLERIRWANEAALQIGMPALIASKGLRNSIITPEYLDDFFGIKLARFKPESSNPDNNVISYGVTVPVGWHSEQLKEEDLLWGDNDECWKGPCWSVLESIILNPIGELVACCGIGSDDIPEMTIGSTNEKPLLELLKAGDSDLILNWLALEGPYAIMRFIKERAPEISFREKYVNLCHVCHDVLTLPEARSVLRETIREKKLDLSIERAWLELHREDLYNQNLDQ